MVKISPISARRAATLLLPLTLIAAPALAQTAVKEDSVVVQPDKIDDDAPQIESAAEANLPSWSKANAEALLRVIEGIGAEGLFAKDYNPEGLAAAIVSDDQARLDRTATDSFLLLATHLRDGRTPFGAQRQPFL